MRTFQYDSFSRLLWARNPEAGVICYGQGDGTVAGCQKNGYDGNGNLLHKTDARAITLDFSYDALNRITRKQSTGGTGVAAFNYTFGYDTISPAQPNLVGRLVWATNGASTSDTYFYDAMGKVTEHKVGLPSNYSPWAPYILTAAYDLAGNVTDLTYPDGKHIQQTMDAAGRLYSSALVGIAGVPQTQSYLNSVTYNPDGSPNVLTLGNGVQQTIAKNKRLQVQSLSVTATSGPMSGATLLSHTYCYVGCTTGGTANNGNIWGITDTLKAANNKGFTYDSLNRIGSFYLNGVLNQKYDIDSFGNMSGDVGGFPVTTFDPATNRINNLPCASSMAPLPSYDAAGNQVCSTDANGAVSHYSYNADSQISQIAMLGYESSPFVSYLYNGSGTRVRKSNASGTFTEYVDFGGQPMAEKDQTGAWTDYIYANGQKIARLGPDTRFHLYGTVTQVGGENGIALTPPPNIVIQPNDLISWRQFNHNAVGGINVAFDNGTQTAWHVHAYDDQDLNQDYTEDQWLYRTANLYEYAGAKITSIQVLKDVNTPVGDWFMDIADITIIHPDGSIVPIPVAGPAPSCGSNSYDAPYCGGVMTFTAASDPTGSVGVASAARYYLDDHLGTTQMELSAGGWPVWQGQFMPFGGEIVNGAPLPQGQPDGSSMHYKFTGKERDAESGLDYFGARYYASGAGRWMSPDWADKPEAVPYSSLDDPQTLNLYTYMQNNPLSGADPDGHFGQDQPDKPPKKKDETDGCKICQKIGNSLAGEGWKTSAQITADHRQWLIENAIGPAEKDKVKGATDDVVNYTYNCYHSSSCAAQARNYAKQLAMSLVPTVTFGARQLQSKYTKHAGDFGVKGNYNPANRAAFQNALQEHINDPDTQVISGTYRNTQAVDIYYNSTTENMMMADKSGNFISGWRLSADQVANLMRTGNIQ